MDFRYMQIFLLPVKIKHVPFLQLIEENGLIYRDASLQKIRHPIPSFANI